MAQILNIKDIRTIVLVVLYLQMPCTNSVIVFHEKLMGRVGAGNYSYYTLSRDGAVTIFLETYEGDSDLYITDQTTQPTFDIANHKLQSVTCGLDRVDVPSSFLRPIIIGVYGHPSQEFSIYELEVIVDDTPEEQYKDYEPEKPSIRSSPPLVPSSPKRSKEVTDDDDSVLWTVFIAILRIILEAFAS